MQQAHLGGQPCWVKIEQRAIVPGHALVPSMKQKLPVEVEHVICPVMQLDRYSHRPASLLPSNAPSSEPTGPSIGTAGPSSDTASAAPRPAESTPIRPHAPTAPLTPAAPSSDAITMRV